MAEAEEEAKLMRKLLKPPKSEKREQGEAAKAKK